VTTSATAVSTSRPARWSAPPSVRLVGRRLLMVVPIILGVSILTFWVLALIPGNAAQQLLGPEATPEQIRALEVQMGLDRPAVLRYLDWLGGAVTGDLGTSLVNSQSVTGQIAERMAVTGELVALAFVVSLGLAVPVALLAAYRPNRLFDRVSMLVSITGLSVANYVLALLLVLVFAVQLTLFPAIGFVPLSEGVAANLHSLALPAAAIAFPLFCFYTRFLRGDLVDQLQGEDYITTARAKGVLERNVLNRHAVRNALLPTVTLIALSFGYVIGGAITVEVVFSYQGVGLLTYTAIVAKDYWLLQGLFLFFSVAVIGFNLVADLFYAYLDPRVREA
jgi:peptide/nickel transport system permease protein